MDDSIFQSSLRLDQIPEKNTDVEDILKRLLKREVSKYMKHFHRKKCELCPFRAIKQKISLRAHLVEFVVRFCAHKNRVRSMFLEFL